MKKFFLAPVHDLMAAFARALPDPPWIGIGSVFVGFVASAWLYVPIHELLHVFGCWVTGGTVERLEVDPLYGATLLQKIFPFVAVGSDYAGQLTGFDTGGNDWIYLATVFAPFLLTLFFGVALLRSVARFGQPGPLPCLLLGVATPHAFAPFANLAGDFYEIGSIIVSRLVAWFDPSLSLDAWRSDDLFKTAGQMLASTSLRPGEIAVLTLGTVLGILLAFATYWAGGACSDLWVRISNRGK